MKVIISLNFFFLISGTLAPLAGRSSISIDDARYKFTSKERDVETGYDYFGARYYDSRIGRWLQVDPLAEKYPGVSPYVYSLNNPVTYFDPDGKVVWGPGGLVAVAGALEILGWATIATGVVISAIGPENTGKGIINVGEQIGQLGSNIISDMINPVTLTPFPVTEGEGINQTTIAPSDATKIPINFESGDKTETPKENVPKPNFGDPAKAPAEGWEWRGKGTPGSAEGSWYNPKTGEVYRPDIKHPEPIKPHYDYKDPKGRWWREFPDGTRKPK